MALRDSWHSALVYFGLAEERQHDEDWDEGTYEARKRSRAARVTARTCGACAGRSDEIDDIFGDEEIDEPVRAAAGAAQRNSAAVDRRSNGDVKVHLVIPKSFNDAQQVADRFKDGVPVILNLQDSEAELSKRLIDFASGLTYALDGGMQRIADKVFMLTPRNVEISAEERARLIEKGFFNQS